MRMIGHLADASQARQFGDFLVAQGIPNDVEADKHQWAIWIHSEDDLERARAWLSKFSAHPADAAFEHAGRQAEAVRAQERRQQEERDKRFHTRQQVFKRFTPYGMGPLTLVLMLVCGAIALYSNFGSDKEVLKPFFISLGGGFLPEVRGGQVWRLFTPALIHFGPMHVFFNLLWLYDLGSMIEGRKSTWYFALLVLVLAIVSNVFQYLMSGPAFGGMSGVVYGLLGYVWMKGKFDPSDGLYLHHETVVMMLIWYFLCLTGWLGPTIANTAHTVGLAMGMAWGFASSKGLPRGRA